tara:strand:+ start:99 stop:1058 length:960 start_codon:yes stop_codon:yes gene_type:complete
MQLGYYHYYFKKLRTRNAPRVCHDIGAILSAYLNYEDVEWKQSLKSDDGETLLLMPTQENDVFMLVATRHQDIIKAISTQTMSCTDISERLEDGESAGFAAYFKTTTRAIALAATLRGPRTAALSRFINEILLRLGATDWKFHLKALGSSITLEQAQGLAHVASTKIKVGPQNGLFIKMKELFSVDCDDVGSFEIIMRGKKKRNLKDVFDELSTEAASDDLEKMTVRAKAHIDEALTDYYVEAEGRFSEDIGTGLEEQITKRISVRVAQQQRLPELIENAMEDAPYEQMEISQLDTLSDVNHWRNILHRDDADTASTDS